MKVKFIKNHPDAVTPKKAHSSDAGFDLVACDSGEWNDEFTYIEYKTGIHLEIPAGHVGYIFPRSSISRVNQMLSNSVGVIDSGYRGEIKFRFRDTSDFAAHFRYKKGDKIGQLIIMPLPEIELIEAENLSESDRGNGGFGSTGK